MSEGTAWGLGILFGMFGPVLLLLPALLAYWGLVRWRLLQRAGVKAAKANLLNAPLAVLLVAAIVGASYLPGRLAFDRLCAELAEPRVIERAYARGFLLDDPTAGSFGRRYVEREGFEWFEAESFEGRGRYLRYSRQGTGVVVEPVVAPVATYRVAAQHRELEYGIRDDRTRVERIADGRLLGESHSLTYHGGPLGIFLGVYGLSVCPDPRTAEGSRQFRIGYGLAREVLGGGVGPR